MQEDCCNSTSALIMQLFNILDKLWRLVDTARPTGKMLRLSHFFYKLGEKKKSSHASVQHSLVSPIFKLALQRLSEDDVYPH